MKEINLHLKINKCLLLRIVLSFLSFFFLLLLYLPFSFFFTLPVIRQSLVSYSFPLLFSGNTSKTYLQHALTDFNHYYVLRISHPILCCTTLETNYFGYLTPKKNRLTNFLALGHLCITLHHHFIQLLC